MVREKKSSNPLAFVRGGRGGGRGGGRRYSVTFALIKRSIALGVRVDAAVDSLWMTLPQTLLPLRFIYIITLQSYIFIIL